MKNEFLEKVYGYKDIKKELKVIQDWYFNADKLGEKKKMLPKGILFYSDPGEGKTHIVREYSKSFNYPIFVIEGNDDNVLDEVVKTYENASKEKNAIVIIDEIDRLIQKDEKLTRVLMAQLDGYKSSSVLTLATCNNYYNMPEALLREGRFDRHFRTSINDQDDLLEMIRGFAKDAMIELSETDENELVELFFHLNASFIRAVFNNSSLRYGNKCTITDIINTADFLRTGFIQKNEKFKVTQRVAIHEAGHAVYLYLFSNTQKFLRIYFDNDGGKTVYRDLEENETRENREEKIRCALAGLIAEDLLLKNHGIGCGEDLEKVYNLSFRLVNRTCIDGIKYYCTRDEYLDKKSNSEYLNRIFDHKASVYMRKNYKLVKKQLSQHKGLILRVADILVEKKELKRNDFLTIVEQNQGSNQNLRITFELR